MVAEARFSLEAVDNTRAAFLAVQRGLKQMKEQADVAGKSLTKSLDLKHALRSVALAVGLSADKISERLARAFTGTSAEQEKLSDEGLALQQQLAEEQKKNARERLNDEQQLLQLKQQRAQLEKAISGPKADAGTQAYNDNLISQIALEKTNTEISKLGNKILEDRNKIIEEGSKSREEYNLAEKELGTLQNQLFGSRISLQEKITGLQADEGRIMKALADTALSDYGTRKELVKALGEDYKQLIPLVNEYRQTARDAAQVVASGFEDAVFAANDFRSILRSMASDILRLFFREQVTAPLASGLGDFFNKILGRADGGPVMGSTPYIVGERGPELFVPRASGTIVSNENLRGGGGGGGINITYNIASGVTRAELGPLLEIERRRLKAEIPDMVRRGGAYRAAFA
jgi:hypothetical protein